MRIAVTAVSFRRVCAGVVERSVYVAAGLALYHRLGFRDVGIRRRFGRLRGRWRDVVMLERRSGLVGGA